MERIQTNTHPDLIITSDWHLRDDTPTCRTDNFWETQWEKVLFIKKLQAKYNCPVIHAGDLTHTWKSSPNLLSMAITCLPDKFYTCLGQHDLQNHSLDLIQKCGTYTLERAGALTILNGTHWGQEPVEIAHSELPLDILVWHHLTYLQKPYPDAVGGMAEGILRKYNQYRLVITGDNHCSFTTEYQGRRLVNPGNLTRQVADQADFQPRIALWFKTTNTIMWVNLPIQKDAISRDHLEKKEERDGRIDAFVSGLNSDWKAKMSFEDNLEEFFQVNETRDSVKQIIYQSLE